MSVSQATRVLDSEVLDPDATDQKLATSSSGRSSGGSANLGRFASVAWDRNDLREQAQVVIAVSKVLRANSSQDDDESNLDQVFRLYIDALAKAGSDPALSRIVWQNLHPLLESHSGLFVNQIEQPTTRDNIALMAMMPRIIERILSRKEFDPRPIAKLISSLTSWKPETAALALGQLSAKIQNHEISGDHLMSLKQATQSRLKTILDGSADSPMYLPAAILATSWEDSRAVQVVRGVVASNSSPWDQRFAALNASIAMKDKGLIDSVAAILDSTSTTTNAKSQILNSLSKLDDLKVADMILSRYAKFDPDLQSRLSNC